MEIWTGGGLLTVANIYHIDDKGTERQPEDNQGNEQILLPKATKQCALACEVAIDDELTALLEGKNRRLEVHSAPTMTTPPSLSQVPEFQTEALPKTELG
jgi:hypothetical protein